MQDEADTNHMANDWINFFQQPANGEVPDLCQESYQHGWRSSGSGTASGESEAPEECYCGAICGCGK
eukprot:5315704-Heterocapsa_arctica.AAC.1